MEEFGMLLFTLSCHENRQGRLISLGVTGRALNNEVVRWQQLNLEMGARVRIKIVETNKVDKPEVLQRAPRDPLKYEKAYVRKMAKNFGWTIQANNRKKKAL